MSSVNFSISNSSKLLRQSAKTHSYPYHKSKYWQNHQTNGTLMSLPVSPPECEDATFNKLLPHGNSHLQNLFGLLLDQRSLYRAIHRKQLHHQQHQRVTQPSLHLQGGFQTHLTPCCVHLCLLARPSSQWCCHTEDMEDSAQSVQKQHLYAQLGHRRLSVCDVTSLAHLQLWQSWLLALWGAGL